MNSPSLVTQQEADGRERGPKRREHQMWPLFVGVVWVVVWCSLCYFVFSICKVFFQHPQGKSVSENPRGISISDLVSSCVVSDRELI